MNDLITTVLPWARGKTYTLEEVAEAARDFYGPHARLHGPLSVPGVPFVGVIEAGHDRYHVIEVREAAA